MNQEDKPQIIKRKKDIDFLIKWLKKSDVMKVSGFRYYTEIQYSEMKKNVRLSILKEVDKRFVRIWNQRSRKLQNPEDTDCKEFLSDSWYKAKQIDQHDELFWREWLVLMERLKQWGKE